MATTIESELERRQQELEIRAAELAAREEALRQNVEFTRQHNWPPLPSFCPFKPCFFQDINIDIRPEFQRTVQLGYNLWLAFVLTELLNLIASIVLISYGGESNLAFAIFTIIVCVPLTYVAWFRPLYRAFKNDSSFNFMVFFFIFFMKILVIGLWSLGVQNSAACGLFVFLHNMKTSAILTIILFLSTTAWMAYTAACVLYLLKVHSIYRSSGASLSKAKSEFAQGVISNRYVQQTVANAARTTVEQTFTGTTTNPNNQPS